MTVKSKIAAAFSTVVLNAAGFEVHRVLTWYNPDGGLSGRGIIK